MGGIEFLFPLPTFLLPSFSRRPRLLRLLPELRPASSPPGRYKGRLSRSRRRSLPSNTLIKTFQVRRGFSGSTLRESSTRLSMHVFNVIFYFSYSKLFAKLHVNNSPRDCWSLYRIKLACVKCDKLEPNKIFILDFNNADQQAANKLMFLNFLKSD